MPESPIQKGGGCWVTVSLTETPSPVAPFWRQPQLMSLGQSYSVRGCSDRCFLVTPNSCIVLTFTTSVSSKCMGHFLGDNLAIRPGTVLILCSIKTVWPHLFEKTSNNSSYKLELDDLAIVSLLSALLGVSRPPQQWVLVLFDSGSTSIPIMLFLYFQALNKFTWKTWLGGFLPGRLTL